MWKINVKDIIKEKRKIIEETYTIDEIELQHWHLQGIDDGFKVRMIVTYVDKQDTFRWICKGICGTTM